MTKRGLFSQPVILFSSASILITDINGHTDKVSQDLPYRLEINLTPVSILYKKFLFVA